MAKAATTRTTTDKAHEAVDKAAAGAHKAVDSTAQASSKAADAVSQKAARLRETEEELVGKARDYISKNPLAAVGIAAGAGFLISRLLRK